MEKVERPLTMSKEAEHGIRYRDPENPSWPLNSADRACLLRELDAERKAHDEMRAEHNADRNALQVAVDRIVAMSRENATLRERLANLVAYCREWGSWEDGVPDASCWPKGGQVATAFDDAVAELATSAAETPSPADKCLSCGRVGEPGYPLVDGFCSEDCLRANEEARQ